MLARILGWLGVAFLAFSGFMYAKLAANERMNLEPVNVVLSLKPNLIRPPQFLADVDYRDYEIDIDFDAKIDQLPIVRSAAMPSSPKRSDYVITCLLGAPTDPNACDGIANLIDISWSVLDESGHAVAQGSSRDMMKVQFESNALVTRTLGTFHAKKHNRYTLVAGIKSDASALDEAEPRLVIRIPHGLWEDNGMNLYFLRLAAISAGVVGLSLELVLAVYVMRSRWR